MPSGLVLQQIDKHVFLSIPIPLLLPAAPAAIKVDNIRSSKYSQVLLMMGENIARNMYSRLGIYKLKMLHLVGHQLQLY